MGIAFGYGFHDIAYDGGQWIAKRIHLIPSKTAQQTVLGQTSDSEFITTIQYDGIQFSPRKAHVRKGNYVLLTNTSPKALLWILSDMPGVATTRGYAQGEQFQFTASDPGVYTIKNKLDPHASFQLTVSP